MNLIEILNKHHQIKLAICKDKMMIRFDDITMENIYADELIIKIKTSFLKLSIKDIKFKTSPVTEVYLSKYEGLNYYVLLD